VFFFALLATGAYIAFDVLDLDASDLRGRPAGGVAVAELVGTEAGDRLRQDHSRPEAPVRRLATPPALLAAPHRLAAPRAAAMASAARRDGFLTRAHLARSAARSDSPPSDPA
jgi:hypothetical protein